MASHLQHVVAVSLRGVAELRALAHRDVTPHLTDNLTTPTTIPNRPSLGTDGDAMATFALGAARDALQCRPRVDGDRGVAARWRCRAPEVTVLFDDGAAVVVEA